MDRDGFKYLNQEFDSKALDLVKPKRFYPCEFMSNFEKFKEELPSQEKFSSPLIGKKVSDKEYVFVFLRLGIILKWKQWNIMTIITKGFHVLKMWCC